MAHSNRHFALIATSPTGWWDHGIPAAASRAGEIGLLNLTYLRDPSRAVALTERFLRAARGPRGVVLGGLADPVETAVLDCVRDLDLLLLAHDEPSALAEVLPRARAVARQVGFVAVCQAQASAAEALGADFVVAKGHESGGAVGEETSFILLQRLLATIRVPIYAWGGIGPCTAAACRAAGAAGVVLDWQLALLGESTLPPAVKRLLASMKGMETAVVAGPEGGFFRYLAHPRTTAKDRIAALYEQNVGQQGPGRAAWHAALAALMEDEDPESRLWAVGQDAAFAAMLARDDHSVGQTLRRLREHVDRATAAASRTLSLTRDSLLAHEHGTEFPILQGPMTRVSDVPGFALAVAEGGALPCLALGMSDENDVRCLLGSARECLGTRSWGVGVLGFLPPPLLEGQLRAIQEARPPFAVVAGGYAGVAAALEAGGTRTYLHAPSPELLEGFVADGLRRFVLEGHECGGHVGPLSGFVLWELAIAKLLQAPLGNGEWARLRVIFAGGIHDGLGGAMISVMAQPLVERKAQIGVLIGTGYIFTEEIVSTGAVVPGFQEVAMRSDYTVRLETGPGHALRCADTPYCTEFAAVKRKLLEDNFPRQAVRERLERMNRGRLRIASKGLEHCEDPSGGGDCLKPVDGESQLGRGIYMLGQAAAIRQCRCTIRQLHEEVCDGAVTRLKALQPEPPLPATAREAAPLPLEVAIVGMACFLPGAKDLAEFWDNILRGRCALREIPADRFDWRHWYDPQCGAPDKMCARVGGFIDDLPFDPLKYGIPPASLPHIEPIQLLALELVDRALGDAGCRPEGSRRERTAVILGAGGVTGELAGQYLFRSMLPQFFAEPPARITSQLAQWTEDSFAGILTSVIAGRVANRFDLGGVNFAVDAACASSLAAVYVACRELAAGACDLVIAGGCDTLQMPFAYVGFSTAGALSPSGRCRIFDRSADGIVISEGLSAVVLKRLADAERDGDRVYAVIRAAAGGSDGRCKGITAPRKEGQLLTLARAYAQARFSCASVDLFEAHGTGTVVGDRTECESLAQLLEDAGAAARTCAVGSVKSNVGHTKSAAGVTGLIKAALAVYHRVLPPTLDVESVDPAGPLAGGPLYVNTELRPWIRGSAPRRAGVSSFGFGGTNFHVVLEEYEDDLGPRRRGAGRRSWPAELFPLSALSREGLLDAAKSLAEQARRSDDGQDPAALANLAYRQHCQGGDRSGPWRAAVVAESVAQLHDSLVALAAVLAAGEAAAGVLPPNVFFAEKPLGGPSSLAMLFPGQGSQYPNMLRDLTVEFTELSECFQEADAALVPRPSSADTLGATAGLSSSAENTVGQANRGTRHFTSVEALGEPEPGSGTATAGADSAGDGTRRPEPSASAEPALSRYIFPPPALSPDELDEQAEALKATDVTQPALGACSVGLLRLLGALGITSGAVAGHSYGELVALHAAGSLDFLSLVRLSRARGRAIADAVAAPGGTRGSMLAVAAGEQVVRGVLDRLDGVWIANFNGPRQIVISGTDEAIAQAAQRFEDRRVQCHPLPVACAFHTPFMAPAKERFEHKLHEAAIRPPAMNVYSNSRAALYPAVPEEMRCVLAEQLLSPVRFAEQIERMYDAGCRVFLEVGPNQVLTRLVGEILADRPHVAVATQPKTEHGLTSLLRALGQLFAHGIPCKLGRLYETRDFPPGGPEFSGTTGDPKCRWLVSGAYARPAAEPPRRMPSRIEPERNGRVGAAPVAPVAPATPPAPVAARPQPAERVLPPERPAPPDLGDDFAQFQDTMRLFLETQRRVMTAYFGGATPTPDVEPRSVVEAGLQPPEPVTMDSRLPASPVAEPPPVAAPTEAQPLPETPHDLTAKLLQVVSRSTGYPADMLDLNANIEADMGIDSIKRLEIVAAFRRLVLPSVVDLPGWFTERMKAAKSLQEILDGVRELLQRSETGH